MPVTLEHHPVHPDISVDRAWKLRTRVYISCARYSPLRAELEAMGANWDTKRKALWVGPRKHRAALDAVLHAEERAIHRRRTLAAGHWVTIPFEATEIRTRAKDLGSAWDPDSRRWAAPTPMDQDELLALVEEWAQQQPATDVSTARRAEHWRDRESSHRSRAAEAYARADEALHDGSAREVLSHLDRADREREQAAKAAERREHAMRVRHEKTITAEQERLRAERARRDRIIAASGRTPLGTKIDLAEATTEVMDRHRATTQAHQPGDVLRLPDGRRALVMQTRLRLVHADAGGCPSPGDEHVRTHWCYRYRLELVRLTASEIDAEAERGVAEWDAGEIHQLMQWAPVLTQARSDDRWSTVEPEQEVGRVTVTTGVTGVLPAGQLIVTRDGRAIWQHPGEYDTYVRAEGTTRDPDFLTWCHTVLAGGPRRRVVPGQPPTHYTVTRPDDA
ncbi:hypothetical protein ACFC1B_06945 [Streptomyces xiamenensis]|uniref:hypothetical protein n=1 Tax=Streptomyces xiamenensis TaxID=408015 RepID=UPI0035D5E7E2